MKNRIRLTENQLTNIIKECVRDILEAHGQGLSYATVKSAHDKMIEKGQKQRADQLAQTYADVNNDEDAEYDLFNDVMTMKPANPYDKDKNTYFASNHIPRNNEYGNRSLKRYVDKKGDYVDEVPNAEFIPPRARTQSAARAKRRAQHLNNFYGQQHFDKNDFRA